LAIKIGAAMSSSDMIAKHIVGIVSLLWVAWKLFLVVFFVIGLGEGLDS
jgi:hypothetical protein